MESGGLVRRGVVNEIVGLGPQLGMGIMVAYRSALKWVLVVGVAVALGVVAVGCNVIGVISRAAPSPIIKAAYTGMAGQKVGVMVWTDRAMAIDWPTLQLDLARGINGRLDLKSKEKNHPKELEGTTFVMPESVLRFQRDHPETETQSITDVAPRMDITRLIYIEVEQFSTQPGESNDLLRGSINANLKVIEIANGHGKIAFQKEGIAIKYPEKGQPEGSPNLNPLTVYEETIKAFSTEVVHQFVPYQEEQW